MTPPDRVHHAGHVFDSLCQRRNAVETVGQTDATLVEHHARHESAEAFQRSPVQLVLPRDLDVGDERRHDQAWRAAPPLLIRDAQAAGVDVMCVGNRHGAHDSTALRGGPP